MFLDGVTLYIMFKKSAPFFIGMITSKLAHFHPLIEERLEMIDVELSSHLSNYYFLNVYLNNTIRVVHMADNE